MRIASSIVAFIFLSGAAAAVVPDIAGRGLTAGGSNGSNGSYSTSMSGVHSHPSGIPTSLSLHAIPSGAHTLTPTSRGGSANLLAVPSTGSHLLPLGSPSGTPGNSVPSVSGGHSHSAASRKAESTGGYSGSAILRRGQATNVPSLYSGIPTGTPVQPTASASSYAHSVIPSVVHSHKPSSPSGISVQPKPTTVVA